MKKLKTMPMFKAKDITAGRVVAFAAEDANDVVKSWAEPLRMETITATIIVGVEGGASYGLVCRHVSVLLASALEQQMLADWLNKADAEFVR